MHCNMRFNLERTAQVMTQLPIGRRVGAVRALVAALALFILPAWAACAAGQEGGAAPAATDAVSDMEAVSSPAATAILR